MVLGLGEMSLWFNSRFVIFLAPFLIMSALMYLRQLERKQLHVAIGLILVHVLLLIPVLHSFAYFDFISDSRLLTFPLFMRLGPSEISLDEEGFVNLRDSSGNQFRYQIPREVPLIGVVTYIDSKIIFNYRDNPAAVEAGEFLRERYDDGVIMTIAGSGQGQRIMISSWIRLSNYDEMLQSDTWKDSFLQPWAFDRWIVISKAPYPDALKPYQYWNENRSILDRYYESVFENEYYEILKLKQASEAQDPMK
jgi:hypothetical protein